MSRIAPLILSRADIEGLGVTMADVMAVVEATYRMQAAGAVDAPAKIGVFSDRPDSFFHIMTAWLGESREVGMKWVSYYPGLSAERDADDATALIALNDPDTGAPVALMEAMWITNLRTAACGLVAARPLLPAAPKRVGLVGCGGLPEWTLPPLIEMAPTIEEVVVTSRRAETREAFAARMAARTGRAVRPVGSIEAAVAGCDIVISAIPQTDEQPGKADWLEPGCLVIAYDVMGTWDDAALRRFDLLATDGRARLDNLIKSARPTARLPDRIVGFGELIGGGAEGRRSGDERILAIPTGVASVDVAVGWEIYRRARTAGVGVAVPLL